MAEFLNIAQHFAPRVPAAILFQQNVGDALPALGRDTYVSSLISEFVHRRRQTGVRLAIYGAGSGGALAVRELLDHPTVTYRFLGFIDDDPLKKRMRLHGYQVLGGQDHLFRVRFATSAGDISVNATWRNVEGFWKIAAVTVEGLSP